MADAELAFLDAQKEYDPATSYQPAGDDDDEDEYDPAHNYSPNAQSERSASMPESAGNTPPPTDGEGENGLKVPPAPVSAEVSAAPTPSKQPRTRGGFVDESEDEEEEPVEQPAAAASALLNASGAAASPQRSFTNTPNNTLPTPDVQLHSAQDQGASSLLSASVAVNEPIPSLASTVPNGSTPAPDVAMTGASHLLNAVSARQSTAPVTPVPTSTALPKARLPQDRIGILEDRIAEDPRGDIEAWLSLIDEHRRRHKTDEARSAFDRFLKIFPTAVSSTNYFSHNSANKSRASNGSSSSHLRLSWTSCIR
jgi:cleavage stimulation factor subunit 3